MFENLFDTHQTASETAAPYIRRALPRRPGSNPPPSFKRPPPPKSPPKAPGNCGQCRDKITEMNGIEIKGVCTSANCPLGE